MASATGQTVGARLPEQDKWLVPTIVQLELAKWLTRELDEDRADQVIAFSLMCRIAPLDTGIALAAAELGTRHRLATADAIIYATAQAYDAELLTCDAHFEGLEGVTYLKKARTG